MEGIVDDTSGWSEAFGIKKVIVSINTLRNIYKSLLVNSQLSYAPKK